MSDQKQLVDKLWNYCDILRDDGLSYGDYVEQLTFLLFLKMDDERTKPPHNKKSDIPKDLNWQSLLKEDGAELEVQYNKILTTLGKQEGIMGVIFRKSQNRIQDPAKLRKLIADLIDRENWLSLEVDVKGDAYEGLLEKKEELDTVIKETFSQGHKIVYPKKHVKRLFARGEALKKETIHNVVLLTTTAFGFVAALAWNTLIQATFTKFLGTQSTLVTMLGYAVVVTIVAVIVITYVSKLEVKDDARK